ncbi:MAG: PIN domain-containing protein [Candidatus Dormibacteraceae bacterium]
MNFELLLDNSAWVRLGSQSLAEARALEIAETFRSGRLAVCLPFLLEAGYSARTAHDHAKIFERLLSLPLIHVDEEVEKSALDAQSQLARQGHHRLPPVDLIIAALASRYRIGVLHYDSDFDLLAERTDLDFKSVWLAPRGEL